MNRKTALKFFLVSGAAAALMHLARALPESSSILVISIASILVAFYLCRKEK